MAREAHSSDPRLQREGHNDDAQVELVEEIRADRVGLSSLISIPSFCPSVFSVARHGDQITRGLSRMGSVADRRRMKGNPLASNCIG